MRSGYRPPASDALTLPGSTVQRAGWPSCCASGPGGKADGRVADCTRRHQPAHDSACFACVDGGYPKLGHATGLLGGAVNVRDGDERELVRRCREGSEAAYAELVRAHRGRLYALAYRLTNDAGMAEDVVQETFLAAFRSIERVEPNPSLVPWLNRIAVRTAAKAAGRRASRRSTSLDRLAPDGEDAPIGVGLVAPDRDSDPLLAAQMAELRRDLAEAIGELPFKYRSAVVLRFVMGLDYAEAARTLGTPLNTFKSDLLRGTRMLRERLGVAIDEEALPARERGGAVQPSSTPRVGTVRASNTLTRPNGQEPSDRHPAALPEGVVASKRAGG